MFAPPRVLQPGREAVDRATKIGAKTDRERAYVEAVSRLYADYEKTGQPARVAAYRDAMARLAAAYPADDEAAIFYALSIAEAASPNDKTFAEQLKAGAILERLVVRYPDHPGLAHYIIHSYDVPPLADRALAAARRYAEIAPEVPHAQHMPSHTFTRLGYWQDSIDANTRSADVARREKSTAEELHAMDYQVYAYLQTGQDNRARALLETLPEVAVPIRSGGDWIGGAWIGRSVRAGGDSRTLRAGARRLGGRGQAGSSTEQVSLYRSAVALRARAWSGAYRRHRNGSRFNRCAAKDSAAARRCEGGLLG